jgi:hypothetical protein
MMVRKPQSRMGTQNSACKEPSLLLSFKKNMEEEDGYVTLKYSEESARRDGHDTLMDGWQSFRKDSRSRLRKKNDNKA